MSAEQSIILITRGYRWISKWRGPSLTKLRFIQAARVFVQMLTVSSKLIEPANHDHGCNIRKNRLFEAAEQLMKMRFLFNIACALLITV